MTEPPERRRPRSLPGDSGPSEPHSVCVIHDTPAAGGIQGHPRLVAEWLATPSLNSRQRRQLEELGVTREAVHRCGGLGWARISKTARLYMPSYAGDVAIIQPVWAGPAPSIYQAVEAPLLDDLIAWHPDSPTRWHCRLGTPGAVLGDDNLSLAHSAGWPICFALTPLDWLRGDCRGSVLLEICEGHWRAEDEAEAGERAAEWWGGKAA